MGKRTNPNAIRSYAALRALKGAEVESVETDLDDHGCMEVVFGLADGRHVALSSCSCCDGMAIRTVGDETLEELRQEARIEPIP